MVIESLDSCALCILSGAGRLAGADGAQRLDELEHRLVTRAVTEAGGNLALASRRLGIARSTLYRHLRRADGAAPTRRR